MPGGRDWIGSCQTIVSIAVRLAASLSIVACVSSLASRSPSFADPEPSASAERSAEATLTTESGSHHSPANNIETINGNPVLSEVETTGSRSPAGDDSYEGDDAVDSEEPERRSSSLGAALRTLRDQLERQERPLGSRGPQCPYSPGLVGANDTIWSDRPVFLWRSIGQTLSLYDYETDELIWQQQVDSGTEAVVYDGEPLQPGGLYRWVLMHPDTSDFNATFVVMEAEERDALNAELMQEAERWTAAGLTREEQALERAKFFGEHRLWSDALQELHAVRDRAEVDALILDISVYLCGALETDAQALGQNLGQS